jgi:hypothetical protein
VQAVPVIRHETVFIMLLDLVSLIILNYIYDQFIS